MAITVTATQANGANGMLLRVFVLTGAKTVASQAGASTNSQFAATATWTQSITTTAGSNVYGASSHDNGQSATGSNATIVDDLDDSTNSWHYTTHKALNVTGGATARGYTTSPGTASGPFAQLEILASGTLAEDASAPAVASTFTATTVTTASFTPPAGSLLVALVGSNGSAGVTTMTVSDSSSLTWTEKVKNNPSGGDYAGVWIADIAAAAGGVTYVPPRAISSFLASMVPWLQRDRRDANTTGTAANPLASPLDSAWQAGARYWHLYGDTAARDRRAYFYQRPLVSDPALIQPAGNLDPTTGGQDDLGRRYRVPASHTARWWMPEQRPYVSPPGLLATALLENELLGGADTARHNATSLFIDRRLVPAQRPYPDRQPDAGQDVGAGVMLQWTGPEDLTAYTAQRRLISDPAFYPPQNNLDPLLAGQDYLELHQHQAATHYDRREVPQQRLYISDPSTYPTVAPTDPLTVAWGAGGNYWHLYNRAPDLTDRREVPQQPPRLADPLLIATAQLENELLGGADAWRHAWWWRPGSWPQQRPCISDPSFYPSAAATDPLTLAWGAGGNYWHLYNRAADLTDRREVPQQRAYVSVPGLLATALLENELLGGADDLARHRAWYADRREYPAQRPGTSLPDIPADPLILGDDRARHLLAAGYWPRGWSWFGRLYFPPPAPPPPFTAGTLTAADTALATLTAADTAGGAGGVLTATDQRTGGPG